MLHFTLFPVSCLDAFSYQKFEAWTYFGQAGRPPAEIVVDQEEVRQDHYLRVTLRSTKPFKGFLLRAEDMESRKNGEQGGGTHSYGLVIQWDHK